MGKFSHVFYRSGKPPWAARRCWTQASSFEAPPELLEPIRVAWCENWVCVLLGQSTGWHRVRDCAACYIVFVWGVGVKWMKSWSQILKSPKVTSGKQIFSLIKWIVFHCGSAKNTVTKSTQIGIAKSFNVYFLGTNCLLVADLSPIHFAKTSRHRWYLQPDLNICDSRVWRLDSGPTLIFNPNTPDPSKVPMLRTQKHPCYTIEVQTNPSIGGSNRGFLGNTARKINGWNLRMHPWKGKSSSFRFQLLIFGGVCVFFWVLLLLFAQPWLGTPHKSNHLFGWILDPTDFFGEPKTWLTNFWDQSKLGSDAGGIIQHVQIFSHVLHLVHHLGFIWLADIKEVELDFFLYAKWPRETSHTFNDSMRLVYLLSLLLLMAPLSYPNVAEQTAIEC